MAGAGGKALKSKPGVAAHQLVCAVPFVYAAYVGTRLWLFDEGIAALGRGTYVERIYGEPRPLGQAPPSVERVAALQRCIPSDLP